MEKSNYFSMGGFHWFLGVVEDRKDPKKLGRVRVRIFGYHTQKKEDIPTEDLPWALVVSPAGSSSLTGLGYSMTGYVEGTHVVGFFSDGLNAQNPIILGSIGGQGEKAKPNEGFFDPAGIYPRYDASEQDTNRLERAEKIDKTVVKWRKDKQEKKIDKAMGGNWDEPVTPYAARYPYNHVRESEPEPESDKSGSEPPKNCGHIEEWDDTPGAARLYRQHKSGTFEEIYPEGKRVNKVMDDAVEIIEKNGYVLIKGNAVITVNGNCSLLVKGNMDFEIKGNRHDKVHGNYLCEVKGNMDVKVDGYLHEESKTHIQLKAPRIDFNP